jgi:hypothetical protein
LSYKLKALHSSLGAYVNNQFKPDTPDNEYDMFNYLFNTLSGFDDDSITPRNYKDVLGFKNQKEWRGSLKREFHVMESKGVLEIIENTGMPFER